MSSETLLTKTMEYIDLQNIKKGFVEIQVEGMNQFQRSRYFDRALYLVDSAD
jgi:hypothetical protein